MVSSFRKKKSEEMATFPDAQMHIPRYNQTELRIGCLYGYVSALQWASLPLPLFHVISLDMGHFTHFCPLPLSFSCAILLLLYHDKIVSMLIRTQGLAFKITNILPYIRTRCPFCYFSGPIEDPITSKCTTIWLIHFSEVVSVNCF